MREAAAWTTPKPVFWFETMCFVLNAKVLCVMEGVMFYAHRHFEDLTHKVYALVSISRSLC